MKYLFQNGRGKASKTATTFVITMVLIWIRFMVSDVSFSLWTHEVAFGPLDPMLVAAMIAGSGGVYSARRYQDVRERAECGNPDDLEKELERLAGG